MQNPPSPSVQWSDVTFVMVVLQNGPLRAKPMEHFQTWVAETDREPYNGKPSAPHGVCIMLLRTSLTFWSWIIAGLLVCYSAKHMVHCGWPIFPSEICVQEQKRAKCTGDIITHRFQELRTVVLFLNKKNGGTSALQHCTITVSHLQVRKLCKVYRRHHHTSFPGSGKSLFCF